MAEKIFRILKSDDIEHTSYIANIPGYWRNFSRMMPKPKGNPRQLLSAAEAEYFK